jgi:hyperosmotically inducible periplasmic protein
MRDDYYEPPEAGMGGPEPLSSPHRAETRSDADLAEGVRAAFQLDPDLPAHDLMVVVHDGVAVLGGIVPDRGARQRAVDVARGVEGILDVRDEIKLPRR